jgi:hypothetical protein
MSSRGRVYRLLVQRADGTESTLLLTEGAYRQIAEAWKYTGPGFGETWPTGDDAPHE